MLNGILSSLIGSLIMRFKNKGIATIVVLGIIITISVTAGLISKKYWGNDNPVEQVAEEIIDESLEDLTGAPEGSINIDLSRNET